MRIKQDYRDRAEDRFFSGWEGDPPSPREIRFAYVFSTAVIIFVSVAFGWRLCEIMYGLV